MLVNIDEIKESGLQLERPLTLGFLTGVLQGEGADDTGFLPARAATLAARFEKKAGEVLLWASTRLALTGSCKRCLSETQLDLPVDFHLSLVSRAALESAEAEGRRRVASEEAEASFDIAAVEQEVLDGPVVDLGALVREQILLALPMDALCRESCKGLCMVCGADLNAGECGCERKPLDPRWEALRHVKVRSDG